MKKLRKITPTAEQLPLISNNSLGVEVIRGAAGSGKTSTAILRLRSLAYMLEERRDREKRTEKVRILVLTFNRTLKGYVRALVDDQVKGLANTLVSVDTFGHWAMQHLGFPKVVQDSVREKKIRELAKPLSPLAPTYVVGEVDYILGRFEQSKLRDYLTAERTGRGIEPRVERAMRRRILEEVIKPYRDWLATNGSADWNDVALRMAKSPTPLQYNVAIIDECQDFSANQLRAIRHHLRDEHAVTFVTDTVQRIYARGYAWSETGFDMRGARYHTLKENHRNTVQIAAFAAGLLRAMSTDVDGALPDLNAATRQGKRPRVLRGKYSSQFDWVVENILKTSPQTDSVAFLKPRGGGFFNYLKARLTAKSIKFVEITREEEWPEGNENVALSTFHSAKGLEFDHVVILGLNDENTAHGTSEADDQLLVLRRLLAVAVARARKSVTIGYKQGEESKLVSFFDAGTYKVVEL